MTSAGDGTADQVCRIDVISGEKTGRFPIPSRSLSLPCAILGTRSREPQPG
jgi:hypothetical protein